MKFAKVFDVADGQQVLVTVGTNDDGDHQVKFTTHIEGFGTIDAAPTFKVKDASKPADPENAARKAFDAVDQARAEEIRVMLVKLVQEMDG